VCPCALLCGTTHARQNIGLADGGVIKNENKRGLRDTTVHVSDFGPHLEQGGLPGMIDPAHPVQFGHYPAVGDTTARYDAGGPRMGKDDGTRMFNFQVPADALPGKRLQFQYRNTRVEYIVKRDDHPGDQIQVDILKPGHEWWRGMRKGKAQLLWETGWVNPTISANIGAEWVNDWAHGYKPTEQELKTKTRTSDGKKNATLFLDQRKDFAGEQTVVEKLFCRYGHLVIASPRYHPELAGLGIEYCWGKAKWCFGRYVNDLVSTNLEKNVLIALGSRAYPMFGTGAGCPAPLPVERVRKFARRARTYRMMFAAFPTPESAEKVLAAWKSNTQCVTLKDAHGTTVDIGDAKSQANYYDMINKMYNTVKTHCNMIDIDFAVCSKF
jgi:hypothetical protein